MKPKRAKSPCYCLNMRRATAAITRHYDQVLEPSGVTVGQYSLLLNIARCQRCSVRELADMVELDRSTLARNLKPLYRQGLIVDTRQTGTRNSQLELTLAGKQTIDRAGPLWASAQAMLIERLGNDGVRALDGVLAILGDE